MLSMSEFIAEFSLPTDGTCEEDIKELEKADKDHAKGVLVRAQNLKRLVMRRGKRKLMTYSSVKYSVDAVNSFQEDMTYWYERSLEDGKKMYNACMFLPNIALKLSGQLILPAKQLVLDVNKALSVWDGHTAIAGVRLKVIQPLTDNKGFVIGHVFVPPQLLTECFLYSRAITWILTQIPPAGDSNKMDIPMEEMKETTESEGAEDQKEPL
ncbi:hypothetical protein ACROYT_G000294 [Oculina patagonica]